MSRQPASPCACLGGQVLDVLSASFSTRMSRKLAFTLHACTVNACNEATSPSRWLKQRMQVACSCLAMPCRCQSLISLLLFCIVTTCFWLQFAAVAQDVITSWSGHVASREPGALADALAQCEPRRCSRRRVSWHGPISARAPCVVLHGLAASTEAAARAAAADVRVAVAAGNNVWGAALPGLGCANSAHIQVPSHCSRRRPILVFVGFIVVGRRTWAGHMCQTNSCSAVLCSRRCSSSK